MLEHHFPLGRNPTRVVVLGAHGFLGSAVMAALQRLGIPSLPIGSTELDLADPNSASRLAAQLRPDDSLLFLAALTPRRGRDLTTFIANMAMARTVSEALAQAGCAQLVYISSDSVYPFGADVIDEASPAEPTSLYSAMHIAREIALRGAAAEAYAVLRLSQVFGPGDTHNAYGPNRMARTALREQRIVLFGEGEETRDHIYVDDVVSVIMATLRHRSHGLLNVASGRSIAFCDLARLIAALRPGVRIDREARLVPITHRCFAIGSLARSFPEQGFTPLETGLRTLISWEATRQGG